MTTAAAWRAEFAPPPAPGLLRSWMLTVIAHGLLLAAISWGVHWNRDDNAVVVEAELWSALPQEAAPPPAPPVETAPPPPAPTPAPAPTPKVSGPSDADIAIEKARKAEREKQEQQLLDAAKKRKADERRAVEAAKQKAHELELQHQKEKELARAKELAREKEKAQAAAKKKAEQQAAEKASELAEKDRQAMLKRLTAQAGVGAAGSTATSGSGTAARSSGPSAGYGGRIRARIKPNIVFTDDLPGNPSAEVEVRLAPDGTIVGQRIAKSSGSKAWDDAVLRAVERTQVLPRDTDGTVPSVMLITFRPRD